MNSATRQRLRRVAINLLKFAISAGLIIYLFNQAPRNQAFDQLREQPKRWELLIGAWLAILAGLTTTIVRWFFLVRALELPFRLKDAFRLGFLGYLLNFVSLGSVGGDLFKAVFIAHEQPGRRAEAVATVVVDRVIGLYAMFLVATVAVLVTGLWSAADEGIRLVARATLMGTAVGAVGIVMLLIPGFTSGAVSEALTSLPKIGPTVGRLIGAVRMYRRRLGMLLLAVLLSVLVHTFTTTGIFLIALGLPGNHPSYGQHFLVVPLSMVASALPLPLMALGAFEAAIDYMYSHLPTAVTVAAGQGFVVAIGYRVITIINATIGAVYWAVSRRQVAELIHEAEEEAVELSGA